MMPKGIGQTCVGGRRRLGVEGVGAKRTRSSPVPKGLAIGGITTIRRNNNRKADPRRNLRIVRNDGGTREKKGP